MGPPAGKTAFVAILVLGAITGIVMYYLFEEFTIPKPGIVNSVDRRNLTATPDEEVSSTVEGEATETTTTTETTETTTTTTAAAATLTIPTGAATPGNPAYEPASLTVKKGDEINVVNEDSMPHTVTSGTGLEDPNAGKMFDTSIINAAASAKLSTTDLEAGEYDYHCTVHPFMTGKIIVQ
jgi:cytochrome c oxidase subunit II